MDKLYKASIPLDPTRLGAKGKHRDVKFSVEVSASTLAELYELVEQALTDGEKLIVDRKIKSANVDFYGPR